MNFFYEHKGGEIEVNNSVPLKFPPHLHRQVELVYMLCGSARAFSGGVECILEKGDFFMAFPDCVHYYDECGDVRVITIIVNVELLPEYREIFLKRMPVNPKISNVREDARKLVEMIANNKENYSAHVIKGLLLSLFGILFEKIEFCEEKRSAHSVVQAILDYCGNNYKNEISVSTVAKALNISRSYVSHTFSRNIHLSFSEYINSLRMSEALQLLSRTNKPITEIAAESGFETIRTFNRVFKKQCGVSPLAYRRKQNMTN